MEKGSNIMCAVDLIVADLYREILADGDVIDDDRTGVGTIRIHSKHIRINWDLNNFPMLLGKRVPFKSVLSELLWFIEGSTDERRLAEILYDLPRDQIEDKHTIWTANARADYWGSTELGNIYGRMWRAAPGPHGDWDSLLWVIHNIRQRPHDRRHLVDIWNPAWQTNDQACLPPCHYAFQFIVTKDKLNLLVNMRSCDTFLGLPFNIASYALLQAIVAQLTGYEIGTLDFMLADAHIYRNHIDAVNEYIDRVETNYDGFVYPEVRLDDDVTKLSDLNMKSFDIRDYKPMPTIKAPMAV